MSLMHVPIERIDRDDLQGLIDGKAREAKNIEYKRETYGGKEADRAEFLADVSSFANAIGGDLVIGMDAVNGVPTKFTPFLGNADAELLRLEQMARTGIEPRIPQLQMRTVSVETGGVVIIIRAPKSYRQPHRVIYVGKNRFWARSSAGKFEPNVDELRALFIRAPELAERMRQFRQERSDKISSGDTPVRLLDNRCLILHLVPFSHFEFGPAISIEQVIRDANYFPPFGVKQRRDWQLNLDGITMLMSEQAAQQRSYVQIFRSGIIEAVDSCLSREQQSLDLKEIERSIVSYTYLHITGLRDCGIYPPFAVLVSLVGMKGIRLSLRKTSITSFIREQIVDREQLYLIEVILEQIPTSIAELALALRPILDQLANVAGSISSQSFDEEGNFLFQK
jgi:hypothetical protein